MGAINLRLVRDAQAHRIEVLDEEYHDETYLTIVKVKRLEVNPALGPVAVMVSA